MTNVILSILAHPDDAEFLCAGTLIRLARAHGWQVHIASMTPGDCGSAELPPDDISRMRRAEGARAAAVIGAHYHCLEERDLLVFYNERSLERVTRLLREVRPRIVLTHSPADYMLDHEMTSTIVRAAVFAGPIPNFLRERQPGPPLEHIPHLYYCDPIEGKDAAAGRLAESAPSASASTSARLLKPRPRCWPSTPVSATGCSSITAWTSTFRPCATGGRSAAGRAASPSPRAFASTWGTAIRRIICWANCWA